MKKAILVFTTLAMMAACTGCAGSNKAPKNWYEGSIDYFQDGIRKGWDKVDPADYGVKEVMSTVAYTTGSGGAVTVGPEEYRDSNNKFGYLLTDLDKDGTQELLIGLINDEPMTEFLDLCIWHSDFGATHIMGTGDGDYIYLCDNGMLIRERSFGGTTEAEYMKYSSESNAFECLSDPAYVPAGKYELTPFN